MNILLLGSGGREHALAWKINQSPLCNQLYIAPGNAGTPQEGINLNINANKFNEISQSIHDYNIKMLIVGAEQPLVEGIYDYLNERHSDLIIVGPSQQAAMLEGSKAFAKEFMKEMNIPTAAYQTFNLENIQDGFKFIENLNPPYVLKADGLAAGKGVLIIDNQEEAKESLKEMLEGKFGAASQNVVIEEFLSGIEFSVFVLTNGKEYQMLPIAKDYKRIGEGDTGLNTGGMGAISPLPFVDNTLKEKVISRIIEPTIQGIQNRGLSYNGFVFFGLIEVNGEPYVIEYNCRMGDPETEVVMPRLKSDLVAMFLAMHEHHLKDFKVEFDERTAVTVFLVSGGYPEAYEKGKTITGLNNIENSIVFHAGTKAEGGAVLSNGGRVLAVTSYGKDKEEALQHSYNNIKKIHFDKKYYRTDIGFDL